MVHKLKLMGTSAEEVEQIANIALQVQEEKMRKEAHISDSLRRNEMLAKKKHDHSCPSCQASFEKLDEGFEICKDCDTTKVTIKKGQKIAICNNCNGVIPESLVGGDNKACPHCQSEAGARWA